MSLPVIWDGVKEKHCNCCGESCYSECPIPDPDNIWDDKRPWQRYVVCPFNSGYRMIIGKICLICHIVFKILGYRLKFGTIPKYLASPLIRSNPEEHRKFIRAVKEYIKQVNDNPDTDKAHLAHKLHDAKSMVTEETRKGSKRIQRRTFVQQKTFQELYAHTEAFKDKQLELDNQWIDDKNGIQVSSHK